ARGWGGDAGGVSAGEAGTYSGGGRERARERSAVCGGGDGRAEDQPRPRGGAAWPGGRRRGCCGGGGPMNRRRAGWEMLRRAVVTLPVIWLVVSAVFLLIHLVPGDPVVQM